MRQFSKRPAGGGGLPRTRVCKRKRTPAKAINQLVSDKDKKKVLVRTLPRVHETFVPGTSVHGTFAPGTFIPGTNQGGEGTVPPVDNCMEVAPPPARYMIIINESGLCSLIMSSRMPEAQKFRDWLSREVLPSTVKTESLFSALPEIKPDADLVARLDALEEQMTGLTNTFEQWLADIPKKLSPEERADKILTFAQIIKDDDLRDKILVHVANLLVGKQLF